MKSVASIQIVFCLFLINCSDESPSPCSNFEQNIKSTNQKVDIRVYGFPVGTNPVFTAEIKSIGSIKRLSKSSFLNNELNYTLDFAEKGETYELTLSTCEGASNGTYNLFFSYEGKTGEYSSRQMGSTSQFTVPLK